MKKYQQLILIIISFISVTLFLVYRHEYNRLHYVLEVFNFFGTPCNFSEFKRNNQILDHYDWGQIPYWQENDNFYTYSGFVNKSLAQVIAIEESKSKSPKKCFVRFDDNQNAVVGQMSSLEIGRNDNLRGYIYMCQFRTSSNLPYAVSFGSKFNKNVLLSRLEKRPNAMKITICVPPKNFNKRELIEFISFHKLIGVKYFIFYHNDIPNYLTKYLRNLAEILDLETAFIPWNFPKFSSDLTEILIEKDCELRTSKISKSFIVLNMNEYLVPLESYGIYPIFEDSINVKSIDIPVQKICNLSNNTYSPLVIQNTRVKDDGEVIVKKLKFNMKQENRKNERKFEMVIYALNNCNDYSGRTLNDKSMSKYSTDFIRSTLVQLLIHDQI